MSTPIAAAIHPNTGMDLMAAPTIRNAPARLMFAIVPAVAAAVFAPCPTVFVAVATVPAAVAALFAIWASVSAVVAVA